MGSWTWPVWLRHTRTPFSNRSSHDGRSKTCTIFRFCIHSRMGPQRHCHNSERRLGVLTGASQMPLKWSCAVHHVALRANESVLSVLCSNLLATIRTTALKRRRASIVLISRATIGDLIGMLGASAQGVEAIFSQSNPTSRARPDPSFRKGRGNTSFPEIHQTQAQARRLDPSSKKKLARRIADVFLRLEREYAPLKQVLLGFSSTEEGWPQQARQRCGSFSEFSYSCHQKFTSGYVT